MDLLDAYVIGNYDQRLASKGGGEGGGDIPPQLFLLVVLVGAVVWGLVKLVIALRDFTRPTPGRCCSRSGESRHPPPASRGCSAAATGWPPRTGPAR